MALRKDYNELLKSYNIFKINEEDVITQQKKFDFICNNNHKIHVNIKELISNNGCIRCKKLKYYYEAKNKLENYGYKVLTKEEDYINKKTKLKYICSNNHEKEMSIHYIEQGQKCRDCFFINRRKELRRSEEEIIEYIKNNNYIFHGFSQDYINSYSRIIVECPKSHKYETMIGNFYSGYRCNSCGIDNTKRENHYLWKNGISNLNHFLRGQINEWKNDSLKNGEYKCFVTGKNGKLHIHHVINFTNILKETMFDLNLEIKSKIGMYSKEEMELIINKLIEKHYNYGLGILMLEEVHKLFHKIYGNKHNNMQQVLEFKKDYESGKYPELEYLKNK